MLTTARTSPETMNVRNLLAHIAARYQEAHRKLLPELIELARKVALDMHIAVEETVLFPAMRDRAADAITHPIAVMRGEHASYAAELDRIAGLACGFVVPKGACGSWRRLYQGVAGLCDSLREQIRLEDKVLFPRFDVLAQTRCTCAHG